MAVDNPLQFAIVREDPAAELAALSLANATSALLIASGGDSALSLACARPDVALTLLDVSQAQLDLVVRKVAALRAHPAGSLERARAFGVGVDDPLSLSGAGNFESLFRGLRAVLDDLVMPASERAQALLSADARARTAIFSARYWPVAFDMFFSDVMLEAMFTQAATQHAARGSYPAYFRSAIERGLARDDAATNPWLHHVLLGCWRDSAAPSYLASSASFDFRFVHASIVEAPSFASFDVVSLSNLFDWMGADDVGAVAQRMSRECHAGAVVVIRQLNNRAHVEDAFRGFTVNEPLSASLTASDRSLFYERVLVLVKSA